MINVTSNDNTTPRRRVMRDGTMSMVMPVNNPTGSIVDGTGKTHAQNRTQRRANLRLVQRPADAALRAQIRTWIVKLKGQPYWVRCDAAESVRRIAGTTTMSKDTRAWILETARQLEKVMPEDRNA